ncbi:hypothetical protein F4780DRAFT_776440 [Xylariomycetidae sp. FL0641]|nr:hypothetical protein F4780DRAFT_776440 [Xylariomycetidae sp. FL0641]
MDQTTSEGAALSLLDELPKELPIDNPATMDPSTYDRGPLSFIESLPMELRVGILAQLPDVRSLPPAALSCKALYAAFKSCEPVLVRAVLANWIGIDALLGAMVNHQCIPPMLAPCQDMASKEDEHLDYVAKFIERLQLPTFTSIKLTLADALVVGDFHTQIVSPLVKGFTQMCWCWASPFPLARSFVSRAISVGESGRIARSFYMFEIYRKLFGIRDGPPRNFDRVRRKMWDAHSQRFFSKLAPWEVEQLSCVHDFLYSMKSQ